MNVISLISRRSFVELGSSCTHRKHTSSAWSIAPPPQTYLARDESPQIVCLSLRCTSTHRETYNTDRGHLYSIYNILPKLEMGFGCNVRMNEWASQSEGCDDAGVRVTEIGIGIWPLNGKRQVRPTHLISLYYNIEFQHPPTLSPGLLVKTEVSMLSSELVNLKLV